MCLSSAKGGKPNHNITWCYLEAALTFECWHPDSGLCVRSFAILPHFVHHLSIGLVTPTPARDNCNFMRRCAFWCVAHLGERRTSSLLKISIHVITNGNLSCSESALLHTRLRNLNSRVTTATANLPTNIKSLPRLLDSNFPGNPLWTWEFHPLTLR